MNKRERFNKYLKSSFLSIVIVFAITACTNKEPPRVNAIGTGCEDNYCIWIKGFDFSPNVVVELRKSSGNGEPIAKYEKLDHGTNGPDQVISFRVEQEEVKTALNTNEGIKLRVINPDTGKFIDTEPLSRKNAK